MDSRDVFYYLDQPQNSAATPADECIQRVTTGVLRERGRHHHSTPRDAARCGIGKFLNTIRRNDLAERIGDKFDFLTEAERALDAKIYGVRTEQLQEWGWRNVPSAEVVIRAVQAGKDPMDPRTFGRKTAGDRVAEIRAQQERSG
jgi:hypothetical protein